MPAAATDFRHHITAAFEEIYSSITISLVQWHRAEQNSAEERFETIQTRASLKPLKLQIHTEEEPAAATDF